MYYTPNTIQEHDRAVTIRRADKREWDAIDRLAQLDSAPPPPRDEMLVAEVGGEMRAAISVRNGYAIADPFAPSARARRPAPRPRGPAERPRSGVEPKRPPERILVRVAPRTRSLAGSLAALALVATLAAGCGAGDDDPVAEPESASTAGADESALRYTLPLLNGEEKDLADYEGDVVMVVNTASECGFTPQFEQLEGLYESKRDDGFVILGFPADDVAGQEPRSNEEIAEFCEANYGVEFPMFALVNAEGDDAHPLFQQLGEPDWNFNKYLLDREGRLIERWGASTAPDDPELVAAIDAQLRS